MPNLIDERLRSLRRVKKQWKGIIDKYSALGDDEQGDVLDLRTGRVVEDRGHLRSMNDSTKERDNIWKSLFIAEMKEKSEREKMEQGKVEEEQNIKDRAESVLFDTPTRTVDGMIKSIPIYSDSEEDYDELLLEDPNHFNSTRLSTITTRSKVSQEDNLTVSPSKRKLKEESPFIRRVRRPKSPSIDITDDPLVFKMPLYDRHKTYRISGSLFRSRPGNYSGPLLTPSKVRRMKDALEKSDLKFGNERLKRLVWRHFLEVERGVGNAGTIKGGSLTDQSTNGR
ncbi:DEKNAAC105165 [Brettanomyces naardenensis]|uniref:DEKNAAC105165 n=1 Tax=Brettanomyces naardenensis TaxID=13370 RepID=A0A448YT39_BRENA|nr:DEKNAAC105165 [Brettanomyces naardenensis]